MNANNASASSLRILVALLSLRSVAAFLHHSLPSTAPKSSVSSLLQSKARVFDFKDQQYMDEHSSSSSSRQTIFDYWDTNRDDSISIRELQEGLQQSFRTKISDRDAMEIMYIFDESGDGLLQKEELEDLEHFRQKLVTITERQKKKRRTSERENTAPHNDETSSASLEALVTQDEKKRPTKTEKLLSILPYTVPLLDSLVYGRSLFQSLFVANNPALLLTGLCVPKAGRLLAFFALALLSEKVSLDSLVRFNIQQAVSLDILVLLLPRLISGAAVTSCLQNLRFLSNSALLFGSKAVFSALLASIAYSIGCILLGRIPARIPLISRFVLKRVPTASYENGVIA